MSVITYDPDDMPWTADELRALFNVLPSNTERIQVHLKYHNGKFDTKIPYIVQAFPRSVTNIGASTGITLLETALTKETIDSFCEIIKNHPAYSIDTLRLIYRGGAIDLNIREEKEVKILGTMEVPSACEIRAAVPNLKKYIHVFDKRDF